MKSHDLSILLFASEAVPFAKTGGLADVAGALPLALAKLGHDVTLVMPRYRSAAGIAGQATAKGARRLDLGGLVIDATLYEVALAERARALLVDCPYLYDRQYLYGVGNTDYADNAVRFAALVRLGLDEATDSSRPVDVVHAHDWQAGLAPVYLRTRYASHPALARAAAVFTIHNLAYQGLFPPDVMPALDLDWSLFSVDGMEYWGKASFLKAGINFSDKVTTVSRRYAHEIQTPEFGFGFDGILRRRAAGLTGVLNGIDVEQWNPQADPHLPKPFGPNDLSGKREAKRALLAEVGLPADRAALARPVVGLISRLVDQKGFDLLEEAAASLLQLDATFVLLGSGEPRYEEGWRQMASEHPGKVAARIGFDNALAHLIEGGADIFLMPSRFEPCGLNQMYSLRYGTVPVVHATGGLDDTVREWNPAARTGTGFVFRTYTGRALLRALRAALAAYGRKDEWRALQREGMRQDHSWDRSAQEYVRIYERAIRAAAGRVRVPPDGRTIQAQ